MRHVFALGAAVASAALLSSSAGAAVIVYTAALSGPAESPANASPGTGFSTVTIDTVADTMRVEVSFTGLTGTTTASHIHGPTAVAGAGTGGVATITPTFTSFPLGVTSGTYDFTYGLSTNPGTYNPAFVTANGGTATSARTAFLQALADGKAYLNIHTSTFGGGEIRGFLTVPEPATLTAFAVAAVSLLTRRRQTTSI
ncbi:MAG: CHRD domain-containing protein [Tepidisphaeraceae bacterium]